MREDEVQRSAAAVPEDGDEKLAERPRADQLGNRLVLEERLAADDGNEPPEQDGGGGPKRAGDEEAGKLSR